MGTKPISDEQYAEIIESIRTIPTESVYPCKGCTKPRCLNNLLCKEWREWFAEAWPIVTGTLKELDGK